MTEVLHPCGCVEGPDGWVACADHIFGPDRPAPVGYCGRCRQGVSLHYDTTEQGLVSDCCTWPPMPNEAPE